MVHLQNNFQHFSSGNCSRLLMPRSVEPITFQPTPHPVTLFGGAMKAPGYLLPLD
jgi:hypothetical protein